MDERTLDLREHEQRLRAAVTAGDAKEMLACAMGAELALALRDTDEGLGLSPVSEGERSRIEALVGKAIAAALAGRGKGKPASAEQCCQAAALLWEQRREERGEDALRLAKAAAHSDPGGRAEYLLGLFAFHGFGRGRSHEESLAHHLKAAARGCGDAMFELYAMTAQGLGCDPSPREAIAWCVRAAEAGSVRAMAKMGGLHASGNGLKKDPGKAVLWYERAARAGHAKAAATLGVIYATGDDIDEDEDRAREFFALAEKLGFDWKAEARKVGLRPEAYVGPPHKKAASEDEEGAESAAAPVKAKRGRRKAKAEAE